MNEKESTSAVVPAAKTPEKVLIVNRHGGTASVLKTSLPKWFAIAGEGWKLADTSNNGVK